MFLSAPAHPSPIKHVFYLGVTVVLGVLLSYLVHAGVEAVYLAWADGTGRTVHWYGSCALHPVIQFALPLLGALGGFVLGRYWWQKVYVDRVWAKGRRRV